MIEKQKKQEAEQQIQRMKVKLMSMREAESSLDKKLEEILGRAIDGQDLQLLYELDLKMLNQMRSGNNPRLDQYLQQLASLTI